MRKRLVIAGGGHAHMVTLAKLQTFIENGDEVNVIGPSEYHYYSGMGPGMLGGTYTPEETRFATRAVAEKMGATFTLGKVRRIDPENQRVHLDSGEELPYDVLSCNLGSQVPEDLVARSPDDVFPVKPIESLLQARQRILEVGGLTKIAVGVIGGGPSAVEIAGNIWRLGQKPGMKAVDLTIFTGKQLLPHHPEGVRRMADRSLRKRGIRIEENCRVRTIETGRVTFETGRTCDLDIIFIAVGVRPSEVFRESGIPTGPDGGMLANRYLQSPAYPNIFGGGDCIYFADTPLDKVGVFAVRQNPVIYQNLLATLQGTKLQPFVPQGSYLLIFNLGDGTGIFYKWPILFGGRPAFLLKNYIDRKFMKTFQAFE
jgi:NADH dehydrogenase FAD-containing subunit